MPVYTDVPQCSYMACIFAKGMEDIISLSSGSDSDSDLEVVGCFSDATKEDARPFITTDWIPVKPVRCSGLPVIICTCSDYFIVSIINLERALHCNVTCHLYVQVKLKVS